MADVTFETKVYEKDWRFLLLDGVLEEMLDRCQYPFAHKILITVFKVRRRLRTKLYWGNHFWSRDYCVSTVGMAEEKIRRYVRE